MSYIGKISGIYFLFRYALYFHRYEPNEKWRWPLKGTHKEGREWVNREMCNSGQKDHGSDSWLSSFHWSLSTVFNFT